MAPLHGMQPPCRGFDPNRSACRTFRASNGYKPTRGASRLDPDRIESCENQLLGKALSKCHQQLEWASESNLPPQQGPQHVFFLPQKADPRLRVCGYVQIGLTNMSLLHFELLFPNHDRCLPLLAARKS